MNCRHVFGRRVLASCIVWFLASTFGCQPATTTAGAPTAPPAGAGGAHTLIAPPPKPDNTGVPPLVLAARNANAVDDVTKLIKRGEKVNEATETGVTPLMAAATPAIASILLENGAKIDAKDNSGRTALIYTAGDCMVSGSMRGGRPDPVDRTAMLVLLLKHKADPNTTSTDGTTPLIAAIARQKVVGGPIDVPGTLALRQKKAEILIAAGASVNAVTPSETEDHLKKGSTPLMAAAINRAPKIADLLLSKGAQVDASDSVGNTALIDAARVGSPETVKLLIAHKAKVNVANSLGETPLSVATRLPGPSLSACADELRKAGAK